MHAVVEPRGLRQEHHSAPWDLLPDIQARLVVHRAMNFKRSVPCRAIPALQALPPDIDSRTIIAYIICTIWGDAWERGRLSWRRWRPRSFQTVRQNDRGGAAELPLAAQAQKPAMPVVDISLPTPPGRCMRGLMKMNRN
jgi:hypothetical protein